MLRTCVIHFVIPIKRYLKANKCRANLKHLRVWMYSQKLNSEGKAIWTAHGCWNCKQQLQEMIQLSAQTSKTKSRETRQAEFLLLNRWSYQKVQIRCDLLSSIIYFPFFPLQDVGVKTAFVGEPQFIGSVGFSALHSKQNSIWWLLSYFFLKDKPNQSNDWRLFSVIVL